MDLSLESLLLEYAAAVAPLAERLQPAGAATLCRDLGTKFPDSIFQVQALHDAFQDAAGAAGTVVDAGTALAVALQAQNLPEIVKQVGLLIDGSSKLADKLAAVRAAFLAMADAVPGFTRARVEEFANPFVKRVVDDAVLRELEARRPSILAVMLLTGLAQRLRVEPDPPDPFSPPHIDRSTDFGLLGALLTRPLQHFQSLYGWGTSGLDVAKLLDRAHAAARVLGMPVVLEGAGDATTLDTSLGSIALNAGPPPGLTATIGTSGTAGFDEEFPLGGGLSVIARVTTPLPRGDTLDFLPPGDLVLHASAGPFNGVVETTLVQRPIPPATGVLVFGEAGGPRIELSRAELAFGMNFTWDAQQGVARANPSVRLGLSGLRAVISLSGADSFVRSGVGKDALAIDAAFTVSWSPSTGARFNGSAGLEIALPQTMDIGPVTIRGLGVRVRADGSNGLATSVVCDVALALGPLSVSVQNLGFEIRLRFDSAAGTAGPVTIERAFAFPDGASIAINAGAVNGGGALIFDRQQGRYAGALELKIYSITVKAFGLIETKLPSGDGFSFVIVISAEFTPIQLGLGFTLNGVGGIIGINRHIDEDGLRDAVRSGSLEHLLFPHDVEHEAPQIIHDLAAVLPATDGRYVFGPMAKIGWGTPTIIEAELGIILELPGPRLALLGEVHALLPKRDKGIVTLNLSIAGLLDFPKKFFAIDASLHDSRVGSYPISGDMAMRLLWGDDPSFALAVGGFNPGFQPPPTFPPLRRVAVDLGISGNPSITLQGYFAITSNTAQVGALAELRAHGAGIDLYGRVQFDALFVFSPFSFEASLSAQVRVSFHGHGIGVHLGGTLSGPSPWRVRGEVCVSILWWDACLSFDKSFGSSVPADVPSLDPWVGSSPNPPPKEVLGLRDALQDPRNWVPEPSPAAFSVVSLSQAAENDHPIDPLGVAAVHERVCPLNVQLKRFGSAKATGFARFFLDTATLNDVPVVKTTITFPQEPFAQGQFLDLTDSQKLSLPSFTKMDGGIRLPANDNNVAPGSLKAHTIAYKTKILGETTESEHKPPIDHLLGMSKRSAAGIDGLGRLGVEAYFDRAAGRKFTVKDELFVVSDRSTFTTRTGILALPTSKALASLVLEQHLAANPHDRGSLQVTPKFEMGGR